MRERPTAIEASARKTPHDAIPVRMVAQLTGLSSDVIRVWEKRYAVVKPIRGPRGARLYTAADVSQLRALAAAVAAGRSIGDIAHIRREHLHALAKPHVSPVAVLGAQPVAAILESLQGLDLFAVERKLADALMALGSTAFIHDVVAPLLDEVGEAWSRGELSIAHEHLLSSCLRNLIAGMLRTRPGPGVTSVLLATPRGERHELGLMLAALMARDGGVGVSYVGTDLPASEIANAADQTGCHVVAIGVVGSGNRRNAVEAIRYLDKHLAPSTEIWLGGRDAAHVHKRVRATRAKAVADLGDLASELERIQLTAGRLRAHAYEGGNQ